MTQELDPTAVEKSARAMCRDGGFDPDEIMSNDGPRWKYYVPQARASISAYLEACKGKGWRMPPSSIMEDALLLERLIEERAKSIFRDFEGYSPPRDKPLRETWPTLADEYYLLARVSLSGAKP